LKQGSRIIGVYSQSDQKPMKKSGFDPRYAEFSAAQSYRGWRFMFRPTTTIAGSLTPAAAVTPGAPGAFGTSVTIPSETTTGKQLISPIPFSATTP
jgi:hypothetical protein